MKRVCVVIVTWNRLPLLRVCVAAARKVGAGADILVVDNASSDGSGAWLDEQKDIHVLRLSENTGGAGGFAAGLKWAFARGYEWMWIMDDDVEPLLNPLQIVEKYENVADMIQTAKAEADGSECVFEGILNPRTMRRRRIPLASLTLCDWVKCSVASFEGLFVSRRIIERIGYPDASFFYGLDDLFYGYRASEAGCFIFVREVALRRQMDKSRASLGGRRFYSSSPQSRYYHVRNYWAVMRYLRATGRGSWRMYMTYAYEAAKALALTLLVERNLRGFVHVLRGIRDGYHGKGGR